MSNIKKLLAALGGLCTVVGGALADGQVTPAEGAAIGGAALAAIGVYWFRNTPAAADTTEDPEDDEPEVFPSDAGH